MKSVKIIVCGLIVLLLSMQNIFANQKKTDWRKSFNRKQKAPYGTFLAYESFQKIFNCSIKDSKKIFKSNLDYVPEIESENHLKIIIAKKIFFSYVEIDKLLKFVEQGNYAIISAETIDDDLLQKFGLSATATTQGMGELLTDSLNTYHQYLLKQKFYLQTDDDNDTTNFVFTKAEAAANCLIDIAEKDSLEDDPEVAHLGTYVGYVGDSDYTNCIVIRYGKGRIILHTAPLLLTNYFLLQGNNKNYLERLCSYIPNKITQIDWHQYSYREITDEQPSSKNPLKGLMKYPMWMAAILLTALGLLLYILFNSKRKQREVPIIPPLQNTSLDFVETIGQLYYNKSDHKNLAEKMIVHLLEKIRVKYKIVTNKLDAEFENTLAKKLDINPTEVNELVQKINTIRNRDDISADQLINLYNSIQHINKYS